MRNLLLFITLLTSSISVAQTDSTKQADPVFTIVEKMPAFPGGMDKR